MATLSDRMTTVESTLATLLDLAQAQAQATAKPSPARPATVKAASPFLGHLAERRSIRAADGHHRPCAHCGTPVHVLRTVADCKSCLRAKAQGAKAYAARTGKFAS